MLALITVWIQFAYFYFPFLHYCSSQLGTGEKLPGAQDPGLFLLQSNLSSSPSWGISEFFKRFCLYCARSFTVDIMGNMKHSRILIGTMNWPFWLFGIAAELFSYCVCYLVGGRGAGPHPSHILLWDSVSISLCLFSSSWSGFFSGAFSHISVAHFKLQEYYTWKVHERPCRPFVLSVAEMRSDQPLPTQPGGGRFKSRTPFFSSSQTSLAAAEWKVPLVCHPQPYPGSRPNLLSFS